MWYFPSLYVILLNSITYILTEGGINLPKNKTKKIRFRDKIKQEIRQHKSSFYVFNTLYILVIVSLVRQFFIGNYESVFLCILTLVLLIIPAIIQARFRMELPPTLEIIILLFIFSAEILGEINSFYFIIPFWDTMLHTLNGFLAAAIGCSLIVLLNNNKTLTFTLSPIFVAIVGFCFSMTIGVLWEFFEFGMDYYLGFDMQKDTIINTIHSYDLSSETGIVSSIGNITSVTVNGQDLNLGGYLDIGLLDTMEDLWVNFIGALVFSIIGFFYAKSHGKGKLAKRFMPSIQE